MSRLWLAFLTILMIATLAYCNGDQKRDRQLYLINETSAYQRYILNQFLLDEFTTRESYLDRFQRT